MQNIHNRILNYRIIDFKKSRDFNYLYDLFSSIKFYSKSCFKSAVGVSTLGKKIYKFILGNGKIKILIWAQMHGNEQSGSIALYRLIKMYEKCDEIRKYYNSYCFIIIPILNPDGVYYWTRKNANNIDLNRDAFDLKEIESKILRKTLSEFQPNYCLNLHDQRSIYSTNRTHFPTILSFLSPSINKAKLLNSTRLESMRIISYIYDKMKYSLKGAIGRFSDEYLPNATGDLFQSMGFPTILIEGGYMHQDYFKENLNDYYLKAILHSIDAMNKNELNYNIDDYFSIPENTKHYADIVLRNIKNKSKKDNVGFDIAVQMNRVKLKEKWKFTYKIIQIGDLSKFRGYLEINMHFKESSISLSSLNKEIYSLYELFDNKVLY